MGGAAGSSDQTAGAEAAALDEEAAAEGAAGGAAASSSLVGSIMSGPESPGGGVGPWNIVGLGLTRLLSTLLFAPIRSDHGKGTSSVFHDYLGHL